MQPERQLATVTTVLEPAMRRRLDAAAQGYFAAVHADSLPHALRTVRARPVQAVLLSPRGGGGGGGRWLVDVTTRDGWHKLRTLVVQPGGGTAALILGSVIPALGNPSEACRRFFELLVRTAPSVATVRALTRALRVRPSTFMSRFFRARLPSPKRYLAATRLLYAAALMEIPGFSVADVAYRLPPPPPPG